MWVWTHTRTNRHAGTQSILDQSYYSPSTRYPRFDRLFCQVSRETLSRRVPLKMWQKRTFFGFCTANIFLIPLWIFVPCLEILFFINHYFLVCILKYCTSLLVNSVIEIQGCCFYSNKHRRNSTKKRTAATATAEVKCHLIPWWRIYDEISSVIFFRSLSANLQFHWYL